MSLKKNATTLLVAIALLSFCLSPWVMAPDSNNVVINRFRTAGTSEIYLGSESSKMDVHDDSEKWWDLNGNRVSDILESEISVDQGKHGLCLLESGWNQDKLVALKETGVRIIGHYQDLGIVEISHPGFSALWDITGISEEIRIWHTGQLTWFGDVQTRNIKARESDEYSPNTAWELGYTGEGVSLCVMDTGVDDAHPSLSGKWLGGADISKPKTFLTPRDGSFNADDIQGHGTSCTGMAMGTGAPTGEFMGSAPGARLVDLRIGTAIGYAPGELFQDAYDASLQGSQWAFDHRNDNWPAGGGEYQGIDVLSLSWGIDIGGPSDGKDPYSMALDKLVEAGVHVVVAAGNDGPSNNGFTGMGASDLSITVGATDDGNTVNRTDDIVAYYSSRGPRTDDGDSNPVDELKPDISASGTNIQQCQYSSNPLDDASGNGYGNRGSGTSYATPSVAGVVALMLEANPDLEPLLTREILRATAMRMEKPSTVDVDPFWNRDFGWGIVDGYKAVKMAQDLAGIGGIDIDIQCFITNYTFENGKNIVSGLAWSRSGQTIDKVVLSGGGESVTLDISNESPGQFVNWSAEVSSSHNMKTNLTAVAYRGVSRSLPSEVEVDLQKTIQGGAGFMSSSSGIIIAVVVISIVLTAVAVIFVKRRNDVKRNDHQDEKE